jgi:phosphatidylserine decarboxylase
MALFAKDGYSNIGAAIAFAIVLCVAAWFINHWSAWLLYGAAGLLTAFILYFFRDPDRELPADDSLIVSPADGKVVSITETEEPLYIDGKARQISIFLSPLDVHVNRLPATGTIEYVKYNPGVYLMAWDDRASSMNERADFGLRHRGGVKLFFRQITGFMARRIVYHLEEGEQVNAGERFGMMKFGSRMDVLLPAEVKVEVEEGDRTVAAETVLGRIGNSD